MIVYPREEVEDIVNDWIDRLVNFGKIIENEDLPITVGDVSDLVKRIDNIIAKSNK